MTEEKNTAGYSPEPPSAPAGTDAVSINGPATGGEGTGPAPAQSGHAPRSKFSGKLGFILAAAGSAVGLGNIWRFPYLAAKYGGGIFLLVYILLAVTFGSAMMLIEIALGRKTGKSCIEAFRMLNKKYYFIGIAAAVVPVIILPYYCVIGGWVTKYLAVFVTQGAGAVAGTDGSLAAGYFNSFIAHPWQPVVFFLVFLALTFAVVVCGVEKGVERVSKVLMPVLVVLALAVAIYVLTIPGAVEGLVYYVKPDFSKFSMATVLAALGQLFYSMSLAMGIMITYGSYMKKETNIVSAVKNVEIFDTGIAFLAGLMIVPAVFAMGDPSQLNAGPGLMFITLPQVFAKMPGGTFVGIAFFLLVLLAALTSSVSLMETIVSVISDKFRVKRWQACLIVCGLSLVLGALSALGYGTLSAVHLGNMYFLDIFDFLSNSVLMPLVALLTCFFVGWIVGTRQITDEIELSARFKRKKLFDVMVKYIAPVCLILILVSSVLGALGVPFFAF